MRALVVQPSSSAISASTSHMVFSNGMLVSIPRMRIERVRCSYKIGSALTKYSHIAISLD
jgi:hypothetical protein